MALYQVINMQDAANIDAEETLLQVAECLGGLNVLLSSDVELRGDMSGRDRFVLSQIQSTLDAIQQTRQLIDEQVLVG